MLCIIVPNQRTALPKLFLCVRTRPLLSRRTILYLSSSLFTKVVPNQKSAFAWLAWPDWLPLGLRGLFLCCTFGKHEFPLSALISIPVIFFRYKTRNAFRRNVQLVSIFLSYQGTCSLDKLKGHVTHLNQPTALLVVTCFHLPNWHFPSQWLSHEISLFLHEISVHKSLSLHNFYGKKEFRMARLGFDLGASALQCITVTSTPPRICWQLMVWFEYF